MKRNTPGKFDTFDAVYDTLYSRFPQQRMTLRDGDLSLIRVTQGSHSTTDPGVPEVVFRLVTDGPIEQSSVDIGDGRQALSGRKNSFYLAPADADASWQAEGKHSLLMLAVSQDRIAGLLDGVGSLDPLYGHDIESPLSGQILERMWTEAQTGGPAAALMAEGLFLNLLAKLVETAEAQTRTGQVAALGHRKVARIIDYIDAHMDEKISLEDLALLADLSTFHFCRSFRAATGQSPQKFVTARRLQAGAALLADPTQSLADIAYACGFSSQSHFTATFRRAFGVTPGSYRRETAD
ncbi:MAG: AraC family transcriptional regulator [Pseudomonadota bacterium]